MKQLGRAIGNVAQVERAAVESAKGPLPGPAPAPAPNSNKPAGAA